MTLPDRWRLVLDSPASGAANMSRDESVARAMRPGDMPVLRAMRFDPPAVTAGRFQSMEGLDAAACLALGIEVARRPTGGLAILHKDDFTYSFAAPLAGGFDRDGCFDLVATGIIAALARLGVSAGQVVSGGARARGGWCFEGAFGVDIEWEGKKVCGSAQRVYRAGVLQHGTLLLEPQLELTSRVWGPGEPGGARGLASLREAAGRRVPWQEVFDAFAVGFAEALGVRLLPGALTEPELEAAAGLEAGFAAWEPRGGAG